MVWSLRPVSPSSASTEDMLAMKAALCRHPLSNMVPSVVITARVTQVVTPTQGRVRARPPRLHPPQVPVVLRGGNLETFHRNQPRDMASPRLLPRTPAPTPAPVPIPASTTASAPTPVPVPAPAPVPTPAPAPGCPFDPASASASAPALLPVVAPPVCRWCTR